MNNTTIMQILHSLTGKDKEGIERKVTEMYEEVEAGDIFRSSFFTTL